MDAEDIETLDDLCNYIEEYADKIYVREKINGVWCAVSLSELQGGLAIKHAFRFIREGRIPFRLK